MARGRTSTGKGPGKGTRLHKTVAWLWAETTEPHKITQKNADSAYRIGMAPCDKGSCRINCKSNPNCLNALGEKLWLGEVQDNYWHTLQDPESERRKKNEFVGLKNLGATCYVNTFLQLWFHNTSLRSALYHWRNLDFDDQQSSSHGTPKEEKPMDESTAEVKENAVKPSNNLPPLMPSSCISDDNITNICAHLQLIFAQLQYTSRRYIDPTPLIHSLGLDTAQQQDAQEFSKLFMSLLESTLSAQPNVEVRDVIQKQFGGEYVYVTKCDNCGNKSMTLSQFFELDLNIQGHSSLSQCIKEFLKEEELNGDNQYFCMACNSKQNAKRYIEIQALPPVLNLQLLRFVFDRKTGYKKKLNSHVQFPDVLSLDGFLRNDAKQDTSDAVYDLTAVLMHQGTSAYSGHYVAHIRDTEANTWYKFNDEDIEKMNNKLKLSGEDESDPGEKPAKRPKCSKGSHTSRNAYMLVYTRRTNDAVPEAKIEIPEHLQEMVAKDNSTFEQWIDEMNKMKNDMINKGKDLQASVQSIYQMLPVKPKEDYEWVLTEWLRTWLNDRVEKKPPIDNSSLLCPHGKLHPEKVHNVKRISVKAADLFFDQFGGFPRLKSDSICLQCVKSICRQIRFKAKLAEDDKLIKANSKNKPDSRIGRSYWVGKTSLHSWKRLATIEEEAKNPVVKVPLSHNCTPVNRQSNGNTADTKNSRLSTESRKRKSMSTDEPTTSKQESNLAAGLENGTCAEVSFKGSPSQMDSPNQEDSSKQNDSDNDDDDDEEELIKFNEDLLCVHNNLVPSLSCRRLISESIWKRLIYYFNEAPTFPENHPVCQQCQVESEDERRNLEINKTVAVEERSILNSLYYNKHRPNLYDKDNPNISFHVLSNSFLEKWRSFLRRHHFVSRPKCIANQSLLCPHEKFMFNPELKGEDGSHEEYSYILREEWDVISSRYPYDHVITVTKETTDGDECRFSTSPEICENCHASRMLERARSIEHYRHATIFVRKITDEHDPEEIQRRFEEETADTDSPQDLDYNSSDTRKQSNTSDVSKRRSSRHRKQRGEVDLIVNSNQTLRDIKLELMKSFSVMPMDQHLSLKGIPLSDDAATLSTLGVRPGCLLMLKLDQPQGGSHPETLLAASTTPEKGFQGTGLLGH
ncbi:ubiquitin carboxyl-terminal hydrolase 48 [Exaiptasia diaphana]|uniref:ubiquitinyl hydrolase 1 n=1 Tax=Exaiptasia diaphana TaxID=2652724 RepID=A0A913Y9G2_EXADI|nr:ubiquitin carboxyl-terminal hydrolase 48 [Exaiptasia diaphana]KXJ21295.1 Ubiquitin carboxyl-terminal hydrolase 48 [Exaiptasia diaphana]